MKTKNFKPYLLSLGLIAAGYSTTYYAIDNIKTSKMIKEAEKDNAEVPEEYYTDILTSSNKKTARNIAISKIITEKNLDELEKLTIKIKDNNTSLEFLKKCKNLKELVITFKIEPIEIQDKIPFLPNIKTLKILNSEKTLDKKTAQTIKKMMPNLEKLEILGTMSLEQGSIEAINQIKKLTIAPKENCDIDFNKLTYLEKLTINKAKEYDIAIWLNKEEYLTLKKNKVEIIFEKTTEQKYLDVTNKVEKIVKKLEIKKEDTEQQKLDKILIYTLNNLEYDEDVKNEIINNEPRLGSSNKFYVGGYLFGTLEKKSQICGNYAALVEALSDRVFESGQTYLLKSHNHAWNIIKIRNESYYIDSTILDSTRIDCETEENVTPVQVIEYGLGENLTWYLTKPKQKEVIDESHIPTYTPTYFEENYGPKESEKQYQKKLK